MDKDNNTLRIDRKRNTGTAIIDGYKLFFKNIDIIIRRTWILAIIYALTCGAMAYYFFIHLMPKLYSTPNGMNFNFKEQATEWGLFSAIVVFFFFMVLLLMASVYSALKQHSLTCIIPRSKWYGTINFKDIPSVAYTAWRAFKHLWHYIAIVMVVFIITTLMSLLMESSAIYLAVAHIKAQQSVVMGDQIVMPQHIGLITFAVFTFCGLLQAYIHTSSLFPFYYFYYSKEKNR